jgi:hypothetical protein
MQLRVVENFAYLISHSCFHSIGCWPLLTIIDVSDPLHPTEASTYDPRTSAYMTSFQVHNHLVYLPVNPLDGTALQIVDVRDPHAPRLVSTYASTRWFADIQLDGDLAYLAGPDVEIPSLRDPVHPQLLASYPAYASWLIVADDVLCALNRYEGARLLRMHKELLPFSFVVTPNGGQASSYDQSVHIQFAPATVANTITVSYTGLLTPSQPLTDSYRLVRGFRLETDSATQAAHTPFDRPYTISISYTDSAVFGSGIIDETSLNLVFWDGSTWKPLFPCAQCTRDTQQNQIVVQANALGEFALVGDKAPYNLSLPMIRQPYPW